MEKYSYLADAVQLFSEKWQNEMNEYVHKLYDAHPSLDEDVEKLKIENEELKANLREASNQINILSAQLDMVHLIFGNRR